ncbi:hypothetical protein HYS47_05550 [Candidatus Woesearchaeota archaeon]|nr:hypothetical protein [Candidatus Woesearchaeota archaeon]
MSRTIIACLGLAALVACYDPHIPPVLKEKPKEMPVYLETDLETKNVPRFLDISFFEEAEERLRQYARLGEDEQAWVTDGVVWKDVGGIATKHSNQVSEEAIEESLSSAIMGTLYFYHQHGLKTADGNPVSNFPSMSDLFSNIILNRQAKEYGIQVVSRVVEVYGTWEFMVEDSPAILPPDAESLFEIWMPTGEAIKDLPQRLQDIQLKYHQRTVEDQIPYLLQAYQQVDGISIRFMPNEQR